MSHVTSGAGVTLGRAARLQGFSARLLAASGASSEFLPVQFWTGVVCVLQGPCIQVLSNRISPIRGKVAKKH